jgi:histidinol phosphatase-like PHP family hydrolase
MPCRIAVITDIHYATAEPVADARQRRWGAVLLRRTVERLNRYLKPDVTVVLGDLLDDPQAPDGRELLTALRGILERLDSPWLALPGNHDPHGTFYEVFDRPGQLDVCGVRLVAFDDPERPGFNACREDAEFRRMAEAAADHAGPLVALQHVPAGEPRIDAPHGYTNSDQVLTAMRRYGYTLALSGHSHGGVDLRHLDGLATMVVPALCEAPFQFALLTIDGDRITAELLQHQLPADLGLRDYHSHTQFAYCSEDVTMPLSAEFARLMNLHQLAFTEHSGQLYFERQTYWKAGFCERGLAETQGRAERMADYWQTVEPYRSEAVLAGLEVDADFTGRLVVEREDFDRADIIVGAVHWLRELQNPSPDLDRAADEFLAVTDRLCRGGIAALAHPFRVFRRSNVPVPEHLFDPTAALLARHGVAAEINFHANEPAPEFFAACLRADVRFSFGSDAHALYEVGEFHPHLDLLRSIGYDGDPADLLLPPV